MITNTEIIKFVQDQLGCQCPLDVFNHIECISDKYIDQNNEIQLKYWMNIGNRLLIYIISCERNANLNDIIHKLQLLVELGIQERNQKGFNRFRLVFMGNKALNYQNELEQYFVKKTQNQEKIHLHIIEKMKIS